MPTSNDLIISAKYKEGIEIVLKEIEEGSNASLSIKDEVQVIEKFYDELQDISMGMREEKTWGWRHMGDLLVEHKKKVKAAGKEWQSWAVENFDQLNDTRREQCMSLSRFGSSLEVFYFMGIDFLYSFANLMVKFHGDPEIKEVSKFYGLNVGEDIKTVNQTEYLKNMKKLQQYFKYRKEMGKMQLDKEMMLNMFDNNIKLIPADYKRLKNLYEYGQNNNVIIDGVIFFMFPKKTKSKRSSQNDSIIITMSKFIETALQHINNNDFPPYMNKNLFRPFRDLVSKYYDSLPS